MKPFMAQGLMTEDPLDGPHPVRKSKWAGRKKRKATKRRARVHKKGARQESKREMTL